MLTYSWGFGEGIIIIFSTYVPSIILCVFFLREKESLVCLKEWIIGHSLISGLGRQEFIQVSEIPLGDWGCAGRAATVWAVDVFGQRGVDSQNHRPFGLS